MNNKIRKILKLTKGKRIGLFIDNANWFYPQKELNWRISFSKLRKFLEKYYRVSVLRIYAGTPLNENDKQKFVRFSKALEKSGFTIITKPLKKIWLDSKKSKFQYKCNFDVEIALDVARNIDDIDIVMVGSGDSDFLEVKTYALERKKEFIALCFERGVAWEIRKNYHIFLEDLKDIIRQK